MKVIVLTEKPDHVCFRYRIQAYLPFLKKTGCELVEIPLSKNSITRAAQLRKTAEADLVILQRKLMSLWQITLLRKHAKHLIYDFDDAIFNRDNNSSKKPYSTARLMKFWATCYAADTVIAGNSYLAEKASAYVEPEKVQIIPTCVNPTLYPVYESSKINNQIRLGWIGQRSTLSSLEIMGPGMALASKHIENMKIRVISDVFPKLPGVQIEECPWTLDTEVQKLAECDLGVSWLPEHPWSSGKCGLKVLQYMAAGLPVIANRFGVHSEMIIDGETGFLVDSQEEISDAIQLLANDPELREKMGQKGRELVEQQYSIQHWGNIFCGLIDNHRSFQWYYSLLPLDGSEETEEESSPDTPLKKVS